MASTNDIIKQLEHEVAIRTAELKLLQSIISQLSGVSPVAKSDEVSVVPVATPKAGRGRPRKNPIKIEGVEFKVASIPAVKAKKIVNAGKVGRPKARKRAKGTVVDSVISLLRRRKQFIESETIFRGIKSKHKDKAPEELFKYLSVTLSNLKKKGDLVAVKEDENGIKLNRNYWGLKRWITKEGSIKPAFYFNQTAVEEAVIAD